MKKFIITLTAIFICTNVHAEILNINYMNEDNTIYENGTCTIGGDLILPTPPTKRGYTFNGWMPADVQQIEYLESTGTQWIDTGYYPDKYTGVNTKFENDTVSNDTSAFGTLKSNGSCRFQTFVWDKKIYFSLNSTSVIVPGALEGDIVELDWNNGNIKFKINNSDYKTAHFNVSDFVPVKHLCLFTSCRDDMGIVSGKGTIKLYYFKIYDNDVLVRDMIPVLDGEGVPCMYDRVEKKFYYNAGTGQFVAGPVIGE